MSTIYFAFRDFDIIQNEKIIAKVISTWSMVDLDTRQPKNVKDIITSDIMQPFQKRENDLSYKKIPALENISVQKTFEIRFDDIDVNKHVNNSNYIVWALETLDFDFRLKNTIKAMDIAYKKEIAYGNKILSEVEINGKTTNHTIKNAATGDNLANILIEWN